MKASDLRLGNLVDFNGRTSIVDTINYDCINEDLDLNSKMHFDYIKPIPLTEEWLLKFGYIKGKIYYTQKECGIISFYFNDLHELKCEVYDWTYENIQYVHQLQNLYFALTSEELKIKQ